MSYPEGIVWTPAVIDRLADLWREGIPTKEIGRQLGTTKNSIVGKCHRLDQAGDLRFPPRPSPIKNRPAATLRPKRGEPTLPKAVAGIPIALPLPPEPPFIMTPPRVHIPPPPPPTPAPFRRIKSHPCCWPIGAPGKADFRFCEAAVVKLGSPYCDEHHRVAYVRPRHQDASGNRVTV